MEITHDQLPPELAALPEPARSKAIQMFEELLRDGASEEDAIERAHGMASQWVFERAPGDRSEVGGDGESAPERPAVAERTDRR